MKKVMLIFIMGALTIGLTGCGKSEDNTLVVSTWSFAEDLINEVWVEPFEAETGIDVILDTGGTGERYSKIATNPNHGVDVVCMSQFYAQKGVEEGLWKEFDQSKLTNFDDLYDVAKNPTGETSGPAYTYNRLGIVYNPNSIEGEITSWKDIETNDSITDITIPSIADSHGASLIYAIGDAMGVDIYEEEGYNAVFEELEKLNEKVVKPYTSSTDVITMMESGEIQVAVMPEIYFASLLESVPEIKWVDPSEGAVLSMNTMNIAASSEKEDMAYQFIDYMISNPVQEASANVHLDPPVNKTVDLEYYVEGLPFTPIDEFDSVDFKKVIPIMDDWTDKWNEIFAV